MKVSVEILKRVYESLQEQGPQSDEKDLIDPESHLHVINAFEMPLWHWSQETGTFQKLVASPSESYRSLMFLHRVSTRLTVSGSPESRIQSMRDRLFIIKQCVLRNEHFAPSTLPSRDKERLVTVSRE